MEFLKTRLIMQTSLFKRATFRPLYVMSLLFAVTLSFWGCPPEPDAPPPPQTVPNPDFEMSPPIAKDISIQLLAKPSEAGNLLLVADFGKGVLNTDFHAVFVGDQTFVLRDDGAGGDETKGDGRFSILVKEDLAGLQQHFQTVSRQNLALADQLSFFDGRTIKRPDVKEIRAFNFNELLVPGKLTRLPFDIIRLLTPADPLLKDHSLMITHPSVVEDPTHTFTPCQNGSGTPGSPWSFGQLIREMANTAVTGVTPEAFLMNMLQTWQSPQTINGDVVPPRAGIVKIINTWQNLSGGTLNVDKAPFKLIAIVNRIDLRGNSGYGFSNAGEGRFVFCAIDANCGVIRDPAPFMVILEYGIPKVTCASLNAYAQEWFNLKSLTLGTPAYNNALVNITNQFTKADLGGTQKANGSALNQLRTNELALGGSVWELREFVIDANTHQLAPTTVKQEPQTRFNNQNSDRVPADVQSLAEFVNLHDTEVENDQHEIPLVYSGKNMLAGKAHTHNANTFHWNAGLTSGAPDFINSDKARFKLSLNTCSGCHGGETVTNNFMHVAPGPGSGVPAQLSRFLTGNPPGSALPWVVTDRAGRPSTPASGWQFNDLERRAKDLERFVSRPCRPRIILPELARVLTERPVRMSH